jgi:hypothetical protein
VPPELGKTLMIAGAALFGIGLLFWLLPGSPLQHLGRLPGDIRIEKPGFSFYFPLTTCVLISLLLMGVSWLIGRFR